MRRPDAAPRASRCVCSLLALILLGALRRGEEADRGATAGRRADAVRRRASPTCPAGPSDDPERGAGGVPAQLRPVGASRPPTSRSAARAASPARSRDWRTVCAAGRRGDPRPRAFFETSFAPFAVGDNGDREGLFTGYYEPLLQGARAPDARSPLPALPPPARSGQRRPRPVRPRARGPPHRWPGRGGQAGALTPTGPRSTRGALAGRELELLWVDDPVDRFFLEIQGSGQVRLPDGETVRVGYADQNGRPYRAIGKDLIEIGAIPREQMSMQAIRAWLEANPGAGAGHDGQEPVLRVLHRAHRSGRRVRAARRPGRAADARAARWRSTASSCRWVPRSGSTRRPRSRKASARCAG